VHGAHCLNVMAISFVESPETVRMAFADFARGWRRISRRSVDGGHENFGGLRKALRRAIEAALTSEEERAARSLLRRSLAGGITFAASTPGPAIVQRSRRATLSCELARASLIPLPQTQMAVDKKEKSRPGVTTTSSGKRLPLPPKLTKP